MIGFDLLRQICIPSDRNVLGQMTPILLREIDFQSAIWNRYLCRTVGKLRFIDFVSLCIEDIEGRRQNVGINNFKIPKYETATTLFQAGSILAIKNPLFGVTEDSMRDGSFDVVFNPERYALIWVDDPSTVEFISEMNERILKVHSHSKWR